MKLKWRPGFMHMYNGFLSHSCKSGECRDVRVLQATQQQTVGSVL